MVNRFRTLLAVALLGGFYLLTGALFVLAVAALLFPIALGLLTGEMPILLVTVTLAFVPILAALVRGFRIARDAGPPDAVQVSRQQAPGLWALVDDVAAKLTSAPPSRLYVSPEAGATAHEDRTGRHLHIGAPLLIGLTRAELRAAVAHELSHHAGRHTLFGTIVHRGDLRLTTLHERLELTPAQHPFTTWSAGLFLRLLSAYRWLYRAISLSVRRRQEFEADAAAVAVAGRAATERCLRSTVAVQEAWAWMYDDFVEPVLRQGLRPADLYGTFAAMLASPGNADYLAGLRSHPPEQPVSALDSHPPLTRRLDRIATRPEAPVVAPVGPAENLLADPDAVLGAVQRISLDGIDHDSAQPLDHPQWCQAAAQTLPLVDARELVQACRLVDRRVTGSLGDVLGLLARGEGAAIARALTGGATPDDLGQVERALRSLTGQALVAHGHGRWQFDWSWEQTFVPSAAGPWDDLGELTAEAVRSPEAAEQLRLLLTESDVDLDRPVDLVPRSAPAPRVRSAPAPVTEEEERQRRVALLMLAVLVIIVIPVMVLCGVADHLREQRPPPGGIPLHINEDGVLEPLDGD